MASSRFNYKHGHSQLLWRLAVRVVRCNAQAILIDRGNGLIYDSLKNISWIKDMDISGPNTWDAQNTFAANLTLAGFDDFRQPSFDELASLYAQLPGALGSNKTGDIFPFEDTGCCIWSGTEEGSAGKGLHFDDGTAFTTQKHNASEWGWAVRDGRFVGGSAKH
jgi:hypothetical protein